MTKVCIIAEAGVNHNGRPDLALKLCDEAKKAGAGFIKFQTFKTEKVLTRTAKMAEYQKQNTGKAKSQFQMVKETELSYGDFAQIKNYCDGIGIGFLSTPDDEESLDFLVSLGVGIIKIGSGEINNIPYLKKVGSKNREIILSTGLSTLSEVKRAYSILLEAGAKSVALLHCTTSYPCPLDEVNLRAMQTLKEVFRTKVGYSDHTLGIEVPIAAVAMGAEIIEKHFTLDKLMPGPDHRVSLEPPELKAMIIAIRDIEKALGDGEKKPTTSEMKNIDMVRRRIVAARVIKKGQLFTEGNITLKRSNDGMPAEKWDEVIGRAAEKDFTADDPIEI